MSKIFWAMDDMYYIVSDGSIMGIDDFISYGYFLKETITSFRFTEWFCEVDFSSPEAFNYIKEILGT